MKRIIRTGPGKSNKARPNSEIYQYFAKVYDMMSADGHSLRMVPYTLRIFRRLRLKAGAGLDLCCGTGSAALALAEVGYQMRGVDGSPFMLNRARSKKRDALARVAARTNFSHGVMPHFRDGSNLKAKSHTASLDFVTCFFDSLNYLLTEKELKQAFQTVATLLKSGGLFVFDVNSNHALRVKWGANVYAGTRENIAWIWKNNYSAAKKTGSVETTFFVRDGRSNAWRKYSETHTERAYNISVVRRLLKSAKLEPLAVYRCHSFVPAKKTDNRHCYVARRLPG